MLEAGVPLPVIQQFLGHASIMTTQIYAKLTQETVNKFVREWNKKYWGEYVMNDYTKQKHSDIPGFLSP